MVGTSEETMNSRDLTHAEKSMLRLLASEVGIPQLLHVLANMVTDEKRIKNFIEAVELRKSLNSLAGDIAKAGV